MAIGNLSDHEYFPTLEGKKIKFTAVTQSGIKPYKNLINNLNNTNDHTEQIASVHYYDIKELNNLTCRYKSKQHEIISSLNKTILSLPFHFDKLHALLSGLNHSPDIIAISEPCHSQRNQLLWLIWKTIA